MEPSQWQGEREGGCPRMGGREAGQPSSDPGTLCIRACRRERAILCTGHRVLLSEDTWLGAHWGSGDGEVLICPVCRNKITHAEKLYELRSQAAPPVTSVPVCVLGPICS